MNITHKKNIKHGWRLFTIDENTSYNYFNCYKKNMELEFIHENYRTLLNKGDLTYNIKNNVDANEITYGNLKTGIWSFIDFRDNKSYDVFNIIMLSPSIVVYFFNINDPCFIIQNTCYMDFFFFGRINQRNLVALSLSTSGNYIDFDIIESNLDLFYKIGINKKTVNFSKKMYFFGIADNVGHHLWNEISGLFNFLSIYKSNELIDGIMIGPYDFFNTEQYINDTYKIKTVKFNPTRYPVFLNIYPVFMNSALKISEDSRTHMKKIVKLTNTKQIINSDIKKNIKIVFDIRSSSRVILNITQLYIEIIQRIYNLLDEKYTLNIVFTGRFLTHLNNIDLSNDKEIISQNIIAKKIMNSLNCKHIIFNNLIGKQFNEIINIISDSNLMFLIFGTSAPNLANWICDTRAIGIIQPSKLRIFDDIQIQILKNYNCEIVPYDCFTSNDIDFNCIINIDKFNDYFCEKILQYI